MGAVKDYLFWLEDRGLAAFDNTLEDFVYTTENPMADDLIKEYKNDAVWHNIEPDEVVDDEEDFVVEDVMIDDGDDMGWSPDDYWFNPDGGLTGDAYNFLAKTDSEGDFV